MGKSKLKKFTEVRELPNIYEYTDDDFEDNVSSLFTQDSVVVLELACGKGDYTISLAKKYPKKTIIGIDIQGERLWYGATHAIKDKLTNVAFLRLPIEKITELLPKRSISDIWITFPDPFPKERHTKKRLTSPRFIESYKQIVKSGAQIRLKTDSLELYKYSHDVLSSTKNVLITAVHKDIYSNTVDFEDLYFQTDFERKHLAKGRKIYYISFSFN